MANREELAIIRGARAGRSEAQVALGRLYLFGSQSLPKSLPTALHWLDRAARQGCAEAWQLIGNHIPVDLARDSAQPVVGWYERAYEGGLVRAGLVYAQLTLAPETPPSAAQRAKALRALEEAAGAGFPEAQWLLAREHGAAVPEEAPRRRKTAEPDDTAGQRWLRKAADNGVGAAQFALLEQAWDAGDWNSYLARALPLARALAGSDAAQARSAARLSPDEVVLLSRCARLTAGTVAQGVEHVVDPDELLRFWELAAAENDRHAQFALGLACAHMGVDGKRLPGATGAANFKKAVRWLTLAGEQGLPEAWYALSRIYIKPEFSQRNVIEAQKYLERAAEMGYRDAQFECGNAAWRARRESEGHDVRAVFWLQKAAAQGCAKASAALRKIAPRIEVWTVPELLAGADLSAHPLLAARLELARAFGLSRAEALLLDVRSADRGHCLVIDIRASYGRSRRRLIVVESAQERQLLDRLGQLFEEVDCGPNGPEGNYRQRLYRLRSLLPDLEHDEQELPHQPAAGKTVPEVRFSLAA